MDVRTRVSMCGIRSWSSSPAATHQGGDSCARTLSSPRNNTSGRWDTRTCPSDRTCNKFEQMRIRGLVYIARTWWVHMILIRQKKRNWAEIFSKWKDAAFKTNAYYDELTWKSWPGWAFCDMRQTFVVGAACTFVLESGAPFWNTVSMFAQTRVSTADCTRSYRPRAKTNQTLGAPTLLGRP